MPTPDFVLALREKVGSAPLWLAGAAAVVIRPIPGGEPGSDQVLLVERADNGEWTPVTGIIDPGEEPAVTAERECLEEACVVARAQRLVWVSVSPQVTYANGDVSQYLDLVFRCDWVSGEPRVGDEESTQARWWPLDDLPPLTPRNAARIAHAVANEPSAVFDR